MGIIKKFRIKSFKKIKPIIEFKDVSLAYGKRKVLDGISFNINEKLFTDYLALTVLENQPSII